MTDQTKTSLLGTVLVLLAGISWGTSGLFVRYFDRFGFSTMHLTFFKVCIAGAALVLFTALFDRDALKVKLKDLWVFFGLGVISLTFFTWCYFSTIQAASMSTAAILLYLAPTLVMIMSAILFKEDVTKQKVVACVLAFAGCFFVSGFIGSASPLPFRAVVTGLLSALGYALYSIFSQLAMNRGYKPLTLMVYAFLFATVTAAFFVHPSAIQSAAREAGPLRFYGMLVLMSFMVSLLPYALYTNGLKRSTPGRASIMASIEPVTATVLGALFFHELPDVYGYIGIALVITAIILLNVGSLRKKNS